MSVDGSGEHQPPEAGVNLGAGSGKPPADEPRNLTMENGIAALDAVLEGSSYEPSPMLLHPSLMRALMEEK